MAIYVLLGTLTEQGAETIKTHPEQIVEVNQSLEEMGVKIIAQYAVIGQYDIVTIVDAADNRTIVKVSTEISMHGFLRITTTSPLVPPSF